MTSTNNNNNNMTIAPIITALEKAFDALNNRFYNGSLSRPVITLSEGAKIAAYGWFVCREVWHNNDGEKACELNISSDYLNREFDDIVRTLLHEMIHCSNFAQGIQDCARYGQRHNKRFKEEGEKRGMVFHVPETDDEKAYYKKYGYSDMRIDETVKDEVLSMLSFLREAITIYRDKSEGKEKKKTNNSKVIKYICPICECSCRATKAIHIRCIDCDEDMIIEN